MADPSVIEQLAELKPDKTYYLRVREDASDSDVSNLAESIKSLDLGCTIIVGRNRFDIEEVELRKDRPVFKIVVSNDAADKLSGSIL